MEIFELNNQIEDWQKDIDNIEDELRLTNLALEELQPHADPYQVEKWSAYNDACSLSFSEKEEYKEDLKYDLNKLTEKIEQAQIQIEQVKKETKLEKIKEDAEWVVNKAGGAKAKMADIDKLIGRYNKKSFTEIKQAAKIYRAELRQG